MEIIVGELFDERMARRLVAEARERGIVLEVELFSSERGTIYRLNCHDPSRLEEARDFFRVRMGLPGAPEEPDPEWEKVRSIPLGKITLGLLLISAAIFLTSFKREVFSEVLEYLFINRPDQPFLTSIRAGEVWRLITPIFLHFGFMHILFNSMWIKDLGSLFEKEHGALKYILFILSVGISSNLLQYMAIGPRFGGLSGLVYGLLGFLWIYGKTHEEAVFRLPKRDIGLMIGWYFLCLSGLIGNIANIAHGVGLAVGMIWGLFPWERGHLKRKILYILLALFFSLGTYLIEIARKML